ncbi:uncharacterized protein BDZ99DRAFT_496620 [Mytilinidion resinicola]|uniref:Uncharacterized protein n=1 Tax=Mytilinidion resinicola TaxID=574789 RepID=A0A6A6YUP9_9PEZI|nr:uncharacterized protein BDZ99DRAFT_496620 [Mytilinidion resinicola]KAF2812103.1 hypothetical protein BDZ99DRAFT_496620 [Mytilinidion resinicola]
MLTSGFTNAPVSRFLVFWVVTGALLASLTDTRYYLHIEVVPHLWGYGQWWRAVSWVACYTNSSEVLFAAMTFYHLRVIERLWGSRKFASFLLSTAPYTTLLPPLLLALFVRPLTFGRINTLPAGPTTVLFALLVQYHAAIPIIYKYKLAASATPAPTAGPGATSASGPRGLVNTSITLTSKTLSYVLPAQLALSALPGSALAAAVGWAVGTAYRRELLPGASGWRVPAWVVGEKQGQARSGGFEGLRRRLEGEREGGILAGEGVVGGGADGGRGRGTGRRRTLGGLVAGQFGGGGQT